MNNRAHWSGRLAFILAATGSAIGLGNIWKFPYITGVNGGGAFVLIYLFCIALVGLPILIAELFIGKEGQANVVDSFNNLEDKKSNWRITGFVGLSAAFLILSFYSVVGGWVLDFELRSLLMEFSGGTNAAKGVLSELFASPYRQSIGHTIFMLLTIGIVLGGVKNGLEKWTKLLMPALFILLALLFVNSLFLPGFKDALAFLFLPDFSKLESHSVLEAVGHSFFTLSLGMGVMITYGSYLKQKESLIKTAIMVAFLDTFIALIAGLVIFSIVFTYNLEPSGGPGLMFQTLPQLFSQMTGGSLLSIAFFLLVSFAALSSSVSILEVVVNYFEETKKVARKKATLIVGFVIYLLGFLTVFSTNILADFKIFGLSFFDLFDRISSSYLLPIGGLLISLFVGWKLSLPAAVKIVGEDRKIFAHALLWILRVIAPLAIVIVIVDFVMKHIGA